MDYVVGSVAALISGNVTPNRPKLARRALTPTKHQPSPNVTPKSELVDDRSIFLSPSVKKKKAIVKKSPKRIFQNPDLDVTDDTEKNSSPKADKVKKHLKDDLENNDLYKCTVVSKSLKTKRTKSEDGLTEEIESPQSTNENTPKKKKKRNSTIANINNVDHEHDTEVAPKKMKKQSLSDNTTNVVQNVQTKKTVPSLKKLKKLQNVNEVENSQNVKDPQENTQISKKRNRKVKKNVTGIQNKSEPQESLIQVKTVKKKSQKIKKEGKTYVNPNAITNKDTDSEHESDYEINSENDDANKEILDTGPVEESSDEEDNLNQKKVVTNDKIVEVRQTEEEIKRTIFVGNVPFSKKCKKEIKKIFNKYGAIETVRIRTVPVKDARVTPKVAIIKNELHPDRTTVNVYVKFKDQASVEEAISENNTVLNGCHLRVSRSQSTGAEHDPRCSVFVGNVPFALEDESLREKFEKCGEIVSVRIIRDKKTNAGKGFAFVNFASKDGVELALALSEEDLTLKNRILRVKRCTQNTQRQKNQEPARYQNSMQNTQRQRNQEPARYQNKGSFHGPNQKHQFERKGSWPRGQHQGGSSGMGEGAQRRLMNKRKNQDGGEGPPDKRQNLYQPHKEKKVRKEFVGMTAEKKKKHTFDKGQKKKRALSEILTK